MDFKDDKLSVPIEYSKDLNKFFENMIEEKRKINYRIQKEKIEIQDIIPLKNIEDLIEEITTYTNSKELQEISKIDEIIQRHKITNKFEGNAIVIFNSE
jgi:hypothetical protein